MLIKNIRVAGGPHRKQIIASFEWEDNDQPPSEIYFEMPSDYEPAEDVVNGAFLVAGALPALHRGEMRIRIDGVDPAIVSAVETALAQRVYWDRYERKPIEIDARKTVPVHSLRPPRAASFFSGGVDSTFTLVKNHDLFPASHPLRIRDLIIAYGFDIGAAAEDPAARDIFSRTLKRLEGFSEAMNVELTPVSTNVRQLFPDSNFWAARWHGMVMASMGYMLSGKMSDIFIPATNDLRHLAPWGSSPLIDVLFTSPLVRFYHDGIDKSRLDKMRVVAASKGGVQNLRVCSKVNAIHGDGLNCGICEKCVRTKLELKVCKSLEFCEAFSNRTLTPSDLASVDIISVYQASAYEELVAPLLAQGDFALVEAISGALRRWEAYSEWANEEDWKGLLKRWARKYLGINLRQRIHERFPVH